MPEIATQTENMWEVIDKMNDEYASLEKEKKDVEDALETMKDMWKEKDKALKDAEIYLKEELEENLFGYIWNTFGTNTDEDESMGYDDWDITEETYISELYLALSKRIIPENIDSWNDDLRENKSDVKLEYIVPPANARDGWWDSQDIRIVKRDRFPWEPLHR